MLSSIPSPHRGGGLGRGGNFGRRTDRNFLYDPALVFRNLNIRKPCAAS